MKTTIKNLVMALVLGLSLMIIAEPAFAQERGTGLPRVSPNATVMQTVGMTDVTITYGRPLVKDRTVWGDLVPYNQVWRTGANEAATITFSTDVMIQGQALKAGTYGLFTIPTEGDWMIIFNKEANQWGAFSYKEGEDVLRVTVTSKEAGHTESMNFTIENVSGDGADVVLHWASVQIPFSISVDTDAILLKKAEAEIESTDDWQVPLQYAVYAAQNQVHLQKAGGWIEKSISIEENFRNLYTKARFLEVTGDFADAFETGEKALEKAGPETSPNRLADLKQRMADWKTKI